MGEGRGGDGGLIPNKGYQEVGREWGEVGGSIPPLGYLQVRGPGREGGGGLRGEGPFFQWSKVTSSTKGPRHRVNALESMCISLFLVRLSSLPPFSPLWSLLRSLAALHGPTPRSHPLAWSAACGETW